MKTIVMSFDDARSDFYSRAFPILKHYGIPSTLNVITRYMSDFPGHVDRTNDQYVGVSSKELMECYKSGLVEVACHGAYHKNTKDDVEQSIADLRNLGINEQIFGFASPGCHITEQNKNDNGIWDLVESGHLLYVRSGVSIRREGMLYVALSLINRYVHSKILYKYLNRHNIILNMEHLSKHVLPAVTIFSYTTVRQLEYLIDSMPDSSAVILMLHSILRKEDSGYRYDRFCWDEKEFELLCAYLKSCKDVQLCMTKELY